MTDIVEVPAQTEILAIYQRIKEVLDRRGISAPPGTMFRMQDVADVLVATEGACERLSGFLENARKRIDVLEKQVSSYQTGAAQFGLPTSSTPTHKSARAYYVGETTVCTPSFELPPFGAKIEQTWAKVDCPACREIGLKTLTAHRRSIEIEEPVSETVDDV